LEIGKVHASVKGLKEARIRASITVCKIPIVALFALFPLPNHVATDWQQLTDRKLINLRLAFPTRFNKAGLVTAVTIHCITIITLPGIEPCPTKWHISNSITTFLVASVRGFGCWIKPLHALAVSHTLALVVSFNFTILRASISIHVVACTSHWKIVC